MKKLLLIVSVLALGVCANAQLLKKSVSFRQLVKAPTAIDYSKVAAPARTAVSAITPADGQFWWGYFTESDAASLPYSNGYLGLGQASTISTGIGVKGHHPFVEGGKVVAVRFWLGDDISKINSDVTIWISSSLPDDISSASYTQTLPRTSLQNRLNEIALTTPYVINNADFYIGYSFSISDRSYPIMGGGTDKENGWFYQYSGYEDWIDFYGEEYGNLAFQILIDGVALPENSATPSDFDTSYALMGGSIVVPVKIFNGGKNSISSISYTINGGSEQTMSVASLGFNEEADVDIVFPADAEPRRYAKQLIITKVNGQPNEASDPSADGNLITVIEKPASTPVVEEFTGMWCGWCPVGWDGLEKTKESFGDQVILIAVHGGDELQ